MSNVTPQKPGRGRLGERLIASGAINDAQLQLALKEHARVGGRLGEVIVSLGFCTDEELSASLASQAGVQSVDLSSIEIAPELRDLVPEDFCRARTLIPIGVEDGRLRVAMANSFDVVSVDAVSEMTGLPVEVVAAPEPEVLATLHRLFDKEGGASMETLIAEAAAATTRKDSSEIVGEQPVVKLVDELLSEAVRRGCTDLHIEPEARVVRTRHRVDGLLISGHTLPSELRAAVIARIKLLAELDISESRLPQDGKATIQVDRREVNVRVSTLPTIHGENVVLRILDKSKVLLGLADLGYSEANLTALSAAITRPAGIILVTGPTGSGKTTTLYAALSEMNTMDRKIATLEDPVEYELPVVRQSQVNVQAGLTFARGLRSLLRQDPDIVLVGEMRDEETIEVALRAAMTGHLVLSTMHTNSAVGAIPRLLNMGVEPYLLGSTVVAVVAQRLIRCLCTACREPDVTPDLTVYRSLGIQPGIGTTYRAVGCARCHTTGYKGRRAVAEVLSMSPGLTQEIVQGASPSRLTKTARAEGMVTMMDEARRMVIDGETSSAEAIRHVWDAEMEIMALAEAA